MTPEQIQTNAALLRDQWAALQNQVTGPAAAERGDFPSKLRDQVLKDAELYRRFTLQPLFPWHAGYLEDWAAKYRRRAAAVTNALPGGEALAPAAVPRDLAEASVSIAPSWALLVGIAAGAYVMAKWKDS